MSVPTVSQLPNDASDDYYTSDWQETSDVYRKISLTCGKVHLVLQVIAVVVNLFHFFILTRKGMRSVPVNILMIGISVSDVVNIAFLFHTLAEEHFLIPVSIKRWFTSSNQDEEDIRFALCLRADWLRFDVLDLLADGVMNAFRNCSVYLSIQMALFRTLSVMFPASRFMQKLSNVRTAVISVSGTILFWTIYYNIHLWKLRIMAYKGNFYYLCPSAMRKILANATFLALPTDTLRLSMSPGPEGVIKTFPSIFYPIATVFLLIELRRIRKRRRNLRQSSADKSDSTTILVFLTTLAFAISEGAGALFSFSQFFHSDYEPRDPMYYVLSFRELIVSLKTINAASHTFICYSMSSQYRETVNSMFCCCCCLKTSSEKTLFEKTSSPMGTSLATTTKNRTF